MKYQSSDSPVKRPARTRPPRRAGEPAVPPAGRGKRGPAGRLAYLLRQASAAVRLELDRALAPLDLTLPQFSVLTMIAAYPAISGAAIARLTLLTPQTVNVITRNLLRHGAIAQARDPGHGSILRLQATARGRALLRRAKARLAPAEARLAATARGIDEARLRQWLARVAVEFARETA